MKFKILYLIVLFALLGFSTQASDIPKPDEKQATEEVKNADKLVILWTSGDKEVAEKMVFLYTFNSKRFGWWDDITLIVWGPSTKLLSEDTDLQEYIKKIMDQGTVVKACKACADEYDVSGKLEEMGIEVKYVSEFTNYIKEGRHILTL